MSPGVTRKFLKIFGNIKLFHIHKCVNEIYGYSVNRVLIHLNIILQEQYLFFAWIYYTVNGQISAHASLEICLSARV